MMIFTLCSETLGKTHNVTTPTIFFISKHKKVIVIASLILNKATGKFNNQTSQHKPMNATVHIG